MKELQPHQKRVVDEHSELKMKVEALNAFITSSPTFTELSEAEQGLLKAQIKAMKIYLAALDLRIQLFQRGDQ